MHLHPVKASLANRQAIHKINVWDIEIALREIQLSTGAAQCAWTRRVHREARSVNKRLASVEEGIGLPHLTGSIERRDTASSVDPVEIVTALQQQGGLGCRSRACRAHCGGYSASG